jgi:hypothetical protein
METSVTLIVKTAALDDAHLLKRVESLALREREASVELIAHLAELDARRLHVAKGYGSLFVYCTGTLRLSEHAAYNRIEAARASRAFPAILDLLAAGALNLSTIRLLIPHLTPENHAAVLAEASGRSKRDVEVLVARLAPRPDVTSSVRKLPARAAAVPVCEAAAATDAPAPRDAVQSTPMGAPAVRAPRPVVAPLAPERYRVQFTVSHETHEKLRRVQDLLRREIPDGDPGAIFDRALTLLLDDIARRKLAATSRPRPAAPPDPHSRHVPAAMKRAVWARDAGRCAFVAKTGRRCSERAFLEFHHQEPYGLGGETTEQNLALRCRAHNVYEAELAFGPGSVATLATRPGASSRNGPYGPQGGDPVMGPKPSGP